MHRRAHPFCLVASYIFQASTLVVAGIHCGGGAADTGRNEASSASLSGAPTPAAPNQTVAAPPSTSPAPTPAASAASDPPAVSPPKNEEVAPTASADAGSPTEPSLEVRELTVSGTLAKDAVAKVLSSVEKPMRECLVAAVGRVPKAGGQWKASFIIVPVGHLSKMDVETAGNFDTALIECLRRPIERANFPSAGPQAQTSVEYTLFVRAPTQK